MKPDFLHKPIPGISLTGEPGNAPWEQPPKYTTIDEVIDFYSDRITDEDVLPDLISTIKGNVSLMTIADGMIRMGIMEGMHSIDAGMLVKPVLIELMMSMAEIYGVGYVIDSNDMMKQRAVSPDIVEKVVEEATAKMVEAKEETGGIVARRKK